MAGQAVAERAPGGGPFTRADLAGMPDDAHLVSRCPPDLEVLHAPFDVDLADGTVVQPDLLIAHHSSNRPHPEGGPLRSGRLPALLGRRPSHRVDHRLVFGW